MAGATDGTTYEDGTNSQPLTLPVPVAKQVKSRYVRVVVTGQNSGVSPVSNQHLNILGN